MWYTVVMHTDKNTLTNRVNSSPLKSHLLAAFASLVLVLLTLFIPITVHTLEEFDHKGFGLPVRFVDADRSGIHASGEYAPDLPQSFHLFPDFPFLRHGSIQFNVRAFILSLIIVFLALELGIAAWKRLTPRK